MKTAIGRLGYVGISYIPHASWWVRRLSARVFLPLCWWTARHFRRPRVGVVNATFTLAAVPIPATLPLIVSALGMMGFVARRRKAAAKV